MKYYFKYFLNLLLVFVLLASIAYCRDSQIFSYSITDLSKSGEEAAPIKTLQKGDNDTIIINTTHIGRKISGFGGKTPIELLIKDSVIVGVTILDNVEDPEFIKEIKESKMVDAFVGQKLSEANNINVNAVSGATLSSNAIEANIHQAIALANDTELSQPLFPQFGWKFLISALVILFGVVLSFMTKVKKLRLLLLSLNVVVLGLWSGSFISFSKLTGWVSNGVTLASISVAFLLLISAILMAMFRKRQHYCNWHCPMGSAQELMGKVNKRKIKIVPRPLKVLKYSSQAILLIMTALMWMGYGFDLMHYEVFSAFLFSKASTVVLVIASVFLILSAFINRPYCRFVCPTGELLRMKDKA